MEMLVLHSKHDTEYITNDRGIEWAALDVLVRRIEEGYWYDDWNDGNLKHQWLTRAKEIQETENARAALVFLFQRDDFEYEGIEVVTVASPSNRRS